MRNWAKWLVNHNLRWVLYVFHAILFPVYIVVYMVQVIPEAVRDYKMDFRDIKNEPKD